MNQWEPGFHCLSVPLPVFEQVATRFGGERIHNAIRTNGRVNGPVEPVFEQLAGMEMLFAYVHLCPRTHPALTDMQGPSQ
jgi:hypothetical protein